MAKFEVDAIGAQGNGLAFDHGAKMLDVGWQRDFDTLTDALDFIRTRRSGWAYTDDCTWMRRGIRQFILTEWTVTGKHVAARYRFEVQRNGAVLEVGSDGRTYMI